jgi:acetyl-CoA carboxylase carboxyltransferase component
MPDDAASPRPQQTEPIGWEPELAELRARIALARQLGGPDRVARQHAGGRLTVRERIDRMLDHGSFHEVGATAGKATYDADSRDIIAFMPANCVFGRGTVDGRPVVIAGDDFTLRGGSADASIKGKPKMSEQIAAQFRMPIIRLIEGSGGGGSVKTIETTGRANLAGCRRRRRSTSWQTIWVRCRLWRWGSDRWPVLVPPGWRPATIRSW